VILQFDRRKISMAEAATRDTRRSGFTPSHDHLGDIFATLDAEKFQRCFVAWVAAPTGAAAGAIAVDGKTLRCSYPMHDLGLRGAPAPRVRADQWWRRSPTRSPRSLGCPICRLRAALAAEVRSFGRNEEAMPRRVGHWAAKATIPASRPTAMRAARKMVIRTPSRWSRQPKSRQAQCEQTGPRVSRLSSRAAAMWRPVTIAWIRGCFASVSVKTEAIVNRMPITPIPRGRCAAAFSAQSRP